MLQSSTTSVKSIRCCRFRSSTVASTLSARGKAVRSLALFVGRLSHSRNCDCFQPIEAYAIAFARAVSCKCLLLGRWALDLRFLDSMCPPPEPTDQPVSNKILLIEPVVGQYLPPQIRRCGLRFIRVPGVIRGHPLQAGDSVPATPQLNFNKVRARRVKLEESYCD